MPGVDVEQANAARMYDYYRLSDAAIVYRESATPVTLRSRAGIEALFGGLPLLEPGLVDMNRRHPDGPDHPELGSYAAVARVP